MDGESEKSVRSGKSNKSLLSKRSSDSFRQSNLSDRSKSTNYNSTTNSSLLNSYLDYSPKTFSMHNPNEFQMTSQNSTYNNAYLKSNIESTSDSYNFYKIQQNSSIKIPNTIKSNWSPYNLMITSSYPMLPSQMPPLPALPHINGASSPTFGGNSSSSTYANTTASDENYPHPLYTSKPQHILHTNENYQVMQGGKFFTDISQLQTTYNSGSNPSYHNVLEKSSIISVTNSLVPFQPSPFINQMTPVIKNEWISPEYGNGAMLYSNNSYHQSLTGPSSEATGTTTLLGDDFMGVIGSSGWNNNYLSNQYSNKLSSLTKSKRTGFTPLLTSQAPRNGFGQISTRFDCALTTGTGIAICLSLIAFFSPAVMVILPVMKLIEWPNIKCNVDCESQLISLTIKLILIGAAAYLTFLRNHLCTFCRRKSGYDPLSGLTIAQSEAAQNVITDPGLNVRSNRNHSRTSLPRLTFLRSFLLFLIFIITIVFWLFYGIRILDNSNQRYYSSIVLLASRMTDCLLLVHYLGLVIIFLREMNNETLAIKVLRCPDGETKIYRFKKTSVQLAAVKILRNYVVDFKVYNPFIEAPPRRRAGSRGGQSSRVSSQTGGVASLPPGTGIGPYQPPPGALGGLAKYKFYDVDGPAPMSNMTPISKRSLGSPSSLTKCSSHIRRKTASLKSAGTRSQRSCPIIKTTIGRTSNQNCRKSNIFTNSNNDRYYEEVEYEKRVSKRRVRLMLASEDAFKNLFRCDENNRNNFQGHVAMTEKDRNQKEPDRENTNAKLLGAYEAAQAIFSTLLKPLQKFLRTTRQQPRFSMEWVIGHLRNCLNYDLGYRAFLEPFLSQGPILEDPGYQQQLYIDEDVVTSWVLYSDRLVSRNICDGAVFHLCQGDISLFCTVRNLPNFNLTEEIFPEKCNKFIFKLDSETSV